MDRLPRTRLARAIYDLHQRFINDIFDDPYNGATLKRAALELADLVDQNHGFADRAIYEVFRDLVEHAAQEATPAKLWTVRRSRNEARGRIRKGWRAPDRRPVRNRRLAQALRIHMGGSLTEPEDSEGRDG